MIPQITRRGLIVAPARRTSDLLDELIAHFNWPVLHSPNLRLLLQQIEVTAPHCLLFLLGETHDIDQALRLIARLRDRGPRPYRIAIAHHLQAGAEPTIRAAGVHSLLWANGNIGAFVQDTLVPALNLQPQPAPAQELAFDATEPLIRGPTNSRVSPAEMHPP